MNRPNVQREPSAILNFTNTSMAYEMVKFGEPRFMEKSPFRKISVTVVRYSKQKPEPAELWFSLSRRRWT
jgi:hypothetical protein